MRLLKKVSPLRVKRCFVVSDLAKRLPLASATRRALRLSEKALDRIIGKYPERLRCYKSMEWHLGTVSVTEVGVWKGAGGLPRAWTAGSLAKTAAFVGRALSTRSKLLKHRARRAIPGIMKSSIALIQKEPYLFPIILPGGTMGRKGLRYRMKGEIDDGCMRSIALAVAGKKRITAYIGVPKK